MSTPSDQFYATAVPIAPEQEKFQSLSSRFRLTSGSVGKKHVTEAQVSQLKDRGFTAGLAESLSMTTEQFPLRVWVVDNSGSMQKDDGHRMITSSDKPTIRFVESTRWGELTDCVHYHTQLAAILKAPTCFRLLNDPGAIVGPQQFGVAEAIEDESSIQRDVHQAREIIRKTKPRGVTPLSQHIKDIKEMISRMEPDLTWRGQRVAIIIATDGLPTDEEGMGGDFESSRFVSALRSLEGLPVWVVVRLCTDEDEVVDFYNNLDEQLELSLEVLDDFVGEAKEVYRCNEWLNYALPLHRCREFGFHDRVFDMLDERVLTKGELREFCSFLFGKDNCDGVPDPAIDWGGFLQDIDRLQRKERLQWNPIKKKLTPWIDLKALQEQYAGLPPCVQCGIM